MSAARLARLDEVMTAPLRRRRLPARPPDPGLSQGRARPHRHVRPHGPRARQADARGRHLPHLLDDQADHRGGADDAGRGRRCSASTTPSPPTSRPGRTSASTPAACRPCWPTQPPQFITTPARAADEGGRPRHPHLRPDLRLHDAHQRRRRLSQAEDQRLPHARRPRHHDRAALHPAAGVLAGRRRGTIRSPST